MASLASQTYQRFEVVVQDAASTDGTAELLASSPFERLRFVSEPDSGIGDAYSRAFARCSGAIVTTLDADNLLEPDALERAVALFEEHPYAAALYGGVQMIDANTGSLEQVIPQPFDRAALLRCELVPPFSTSYFSRRMCGAELLMDASMKTCADFDLWLRLSDRQIANTREILGRTRISNKSMTRDPSRYEQFCSDKVYALERHLERHPELEAERAESIAGILCWAAESLFNLEGPSQRANAMLERAAGAAPGYERVERARERFADAATLHDHPAASP